MIRNSGWRDTLVCLAFVALSGCGPGVGGTGTGASFAPAYFGATSATLCDTAFAEHVGCAAGQAGAAAAPAPVSFADRATAPRVVARIEGNRIELGAPCEGLEFSGEWATLPDGSGRFVGGVVTPANPAQPALLQIAASGSDALVATLTAADGTPLLGPTTLVRVAQLAPQSCA